MAVSYRAYQPDQCGLFPVSPRDWLPEGHLVFFISETVDQLDLSELEKAYRGEPLTPPAWFPAPSHSVPLPQPSIGLGSMV